MGTQGILYWTRDGESGEDLGSVWVIEAGGTERTLNGGDLIRRSEAEWLAAVGDYLLDAESALLPARAQVTQP